MNTITQITIIKANDNEYCCYEGERELNVSKVIAYQCETDSIDNQFNTVLSPIIIEEYAETTSCIGILFFLIGTKEECMTHRQKIIDGRKNDD